MVEWQKQNSNKKRQTGKPFASREKGRDEPRQRLCSTRVSNSVQRSDGYRARGQLISTARAWLADTTGCTVPGKGGGEGSPTVHW